MVRTRRMENGDRHTFKTRCSSRNLGQRAVRNYAGNDEDDIDDDDANDRIKTVVGRRKIKIESPRSEESLKSGDNCCETRGRMSKDEENAIGLAVEEDEVKNNLDSVKENGSGIRRSTRKKKFTYDTLNQKWLLEGRVPEFAYINREERRLRRAKKMMEVNDEDDVEEEEDETGAFSDDMYTRIKRDKRKAAQHYYRSREGKKVKRKDKSGDFITDDDTDNDTEEEEEESIDDTTSIDEEEGPIQDGVVMPRTYYLRQKKPVIERFQVQNEPTKLRARCKSILHLSPPRRHIRQGSNFVASFISPAHRSPLFKRRRTTHNSSSSSMSSGSEDERRFERHKAKSMAKARNRVLPMNLTAQEVDSNVIVRNRIKIGSSLADVDPMNVDKNVTFESVGGLAKHIQGLKEMLLLPLMYPEVFEKFKITPPRGVLFFGPPGTGKTLVARALANECSQSERKVAFFMRKGADCLSKWVGESERQLRLLFDQAYSMRPSIIFFDEIDGLAPVRSTRQDQIHSSIVSTLLALMDGLDSRGEVVVIGATNRIDAIDPALRRPGRFDREFNFSLPPCEARQSILSIHTKDWDPPLQTSFVEELAIRTTGYCGADLKALCAEAAFLALRRQFPEIYMSKQKLQLDVSHVKIEAEDFQKAVLSIVPAAQRSIASPGRPLPCVIRPLLHNSLNVVLEALRQIFPQGFLSRDGGGAMEEGNHEVEYVDVSRWQLTHRPRLLLVGNPGQAQSTHLGPAVLHFLEKFPVHKLDLPSLYAVTAKSPEESCAQIFMEAQRLLPSVLYLPHCGQWWETLSETVKVTFLNLIQDVEPLAPLLLLATSDCGYDKLPDELACCFDPHNGEVIEMKNHSDIERREYFSPLILKATTTRPQLRQKRKRRRAPLSAAVPSLQRAFTVSELKKLEEDEEATMRELRLFLREILYKLARDRRFSIFAKPVDTSEVSDYLQVIKTPMDLETMMTKIDLHKYQTVGEFLEDINLVAYNALEYNPDRFPSDKIIRHRACALKDFAHALVSSELDLEFEKSCEEVREARKLRGVSPSVFAPKHCTVPLHPLKMDEVKKQDEKKVEVATLKTAPTRTIEQQLPVSKKSPLGEGAPETKYRSRLMSRRKKSPWVVVRRRRRIVRPIKLVVYSEDSLDVMPSRDNQSGEGQSLVNGDHRQVGLSPVATDGVTFFHQEKGNDELVSKVEREENEAEGEMMTSSKQPPVELASNESVMSVDSLSSNNLSSLSNTDEIGAVLSSTNEKKEKVEEVAETNQSNESEKQDDSEVKNRCSTQREPSRSTPAAEVESNAAADEVAAAATAETEDEVEETCPVFVIDEQRIETLLDELVSKTKECDVASLERIHCRLSRCVYKHKSDWDRTAMLDEIAAELSRLDLCSAAANRSGMCSWGGGSEGS